MRTLKVILDCKPGLTHSICFFTSWLTLKIYIGLYSKMKSDKLCMDTWKNSKIVKYIASEK